MYIRGERASMVVRLERMRDGDETDFADGDSSVCGDVGRGRAPAHDAPLDDATADDEDGPQDDDRQAGYETRRYADEAAHCAVRPAADPARAEARRRHDARR